MCFFFCVTDDESSGLCGFLDVIVHSATGLKHSLSKCSRLSLEIIMQLSCESCTLCHLRVNPQSPSCPSLPLSLRLPAGRAAGGVRVGLERDIVFKLP